MVNLPPLSPASTELIQLIAKTVSTLEQSYTAHGQAQPSLGPSNEPDTGSDTGVGALPTHDFVNAVQLLRGATTQLLATFVPPPVYNVDFALGSLDSAAIGIVVNARVADVIAKHDPTATKGVPIATIAAETHLEPRHLARILRALATRHIFVELELDVFANNRHSSPLRSSGPASCINAMGHWTWDVLPSATKLQDVLADTEHAAAFSIAHSGSARALGGVFWDVLAREPERGARFNAAMKEATQHVSIAHSILEDVPWADFVARNPNGVFVDVGAGAGHQALSVASKLPGWEMVIQDLPHVVDSSAKELWEAHGSQYKYRLVAQDFFKPQSVKGADVYYLKHVIHDWPDKEATQILQHIHDAADPARTRLLIAEVLIEPALPATPATAPLLANLGGGATAAHRVDGIMMTVLEAQERTRAEFEHNVLAPSGWKLVKVHEVRSHLRLKVLECVPV